MFRWLAGVVLVVHLTPHRSRCLRLGVEHKLHWGRGHGHALASEEKKAGKKSLPPLSVLQNLDTDMKLPWEKTSFPYRGNALILLFENAGAVVDGAVVDSACLGAEHKQHTGCDGHGLVSVETKAGCTREGLLFPWSLL